MRQSDEVERDADDGSKDDVDGDLQEEVAGDAAAGIAHGLGQEGKVAVAREADDAVAEVFALEEDEEGEDDGQQRSSEGLDDAAELIEASGGAADFADLDGMIGASADGFAVGQAVGGKGGGIGDAKFVADVFNLAFGAAVGGVAGAVEGLHFCRDVVAVGG